MDLLHDVAVFANVSTFADVDDSVSVGGQIAAASNELGRIHGAPS